MADRGEDEAKDDADANDGGRARSTGDARPDGDTTAGSISSDADSGAAGDAAERRTSEPNEEQMNPAESQVFEEFRDDLEAVERKIAGEIDPGARAMVVAVAVFVLLLSLVLPHAGSARGLDVILYDATAETEHIGLPSRVFEWFVVVFGICFSSLALVTRRWVLAWIAVAGSAVGSVFGVLSIWHRQTPGLGNYEGAGPGIGLILALLAIVVLTFHWVKVVWSRTALHLEAEEKRRQAAAAREKQERTWLLGDQEDRKNDE